MFWPHCVMPQFNEGPFFMTSILPWNAKGNACSQSQYLSTSGQLSCCLTTLLLCKKLTAWVMAHCDIQLIWQSHGRKIFPVEETVKRIYLWIDCPLCGTKSLAGAPAVRGLTHWLEVRSSALKTSYLFVKKMFSRNSGSHCLANRIFLLCRLALDIGNMLWALHHYSHYLSDQCMSAHHITCWNMLV
jgi:hypothetical protein